MCWTCDLVWKVAKKKKRKVSIGACSLLCGHNIDKYGRWVSHTDEYWDEDGCHVVTLYPTEELIEETKNICNILGIEIPKETDTVKNLYSTFREFRYSQLEKGENENV